MPALLKRQDDLSPSLVYIRGQAAKNIDKLVQDYISTPDLMGNIVDFKYRWTQKKYVEWVDSLKDGKNPVRGWCLKFRRAKISSVESAKCFAEAWAKDNWRVGIIAHQEDRAKELLNNFKFYYRSLPPQLQLQLSKDNVFGIKFEATGSTALIGTAQNPVKIRGDGLHVVQLSEGAHYDYQFNEVMKEIGPVVPIHPDTRVMIETTGTQRGSQAHDHYVASKAGYTEFKTKFLCWLEDPEYVIPFQDREHQERIMSHIYNMCPRLAEKNKYYKLTPEQCHQAWNFYHYQSKNDFDYFTREFPYVEDDAWTTGGSSYFGNLEINMTKPCDPAAIYTPGDWLGRTFNKLDELYLMERVDNYDRNPNIKVWSYPAVNGRYMIGADPSYGEDGSDYTSMYVLDTYTRQMMAAYHGRTQPHESAAIMVSLARIYNNAQLIPETNPGGGGLTLLQEIRRLHYNRIYRWRTRDSIQGMKLTDKAGWYTHERSRAIMLGELRKLFIDTLNGKLPDYGMFRDIALIDEMRTFVPDERTNKPRALVGCHDDRVIALAITQQGCADETYAGSHDIAKAYHSFEASPTYGMQRKRRQYSPDDILRQFMKPNMKFELDEGARITWQ